MGSASKTIRAVRMPTEKEVAFAAESSRLLAACIGEGDTAQLRLIDRNTDVIVPVSAIHMLVDILSQMAQGNPVSLVPVHAELTTQQAADMLNVSRPYLVKFHKTGRHRRIRFDDLMAFMHRRDDESRKAANDMISLAQKLGMGYWRGEL